MRLTSPAFQEGMEIPQRFTADGNDTSPALTWSEVPQGARSLALICDDPDAPRGTWVHWVVYDLTPERRNLPESVPASALLADGGRQGKNDFGRIGYGGPSPPPGKPHRYFFKLYALDAPITLPASPTKQQLESAMRGHILAQAQLMGTYGR